MRRYLLDTGPLVGYLNNRSHVVTTVQPWIAGRELATSTLVYAEVIEHLQASSSYEQKKTQLRRLLRTVYPYAPTYSALERYAHIRRQLRPPHGSGLIGDIDTLIAATALERDLTVVTMDTDFQRVPGLNVMLLPRR
jgi:predicted nucleic acid-binding protein